MPPPAGDPQAPPRALIFDSQFDQYRGVVAYVRVVDGVFRKGEAIRTMVGASNAEIDEIGFFSPQMRPGRRASRGRRSGTLITGIKDVTKLRVGNTLTSRSARPLRATSPGTARSSRWSSAASFRLIPSASPSCARNASRS